MVIEDLSDYARGLGKIGFSGFRHQEVTVDLCVGEEWESCCRLLKLMLLLLWKQQRKEF